MAASQYLTKTLLIVYLLSASLFVQAKTPITYFVYKEALGLYQSPYLQSKENLPIGFVNDIVVKVFEGEDVDIQVKVMPALRVFSEFVKPMDTTWVLMGFDDMDPSHIINVSDTERSDRFVVIARYRLSLFQVRGKAKKYIANARELTGKSIVAIGGGRYRNFDELVTGIDVKRIEADKYARALKILLAERADYLVASEATVKWHMMSIGENYNFLQAVDFPQLDQHSSTISLFWRTSMPEDLENRIRRRFEALEKSGWLPQLRQRYGLLNP